MLFVWFSYGKPCVCFVTKYDTKKFGNKDNETIFLKFIWTMDNQCRDSSSNSVICFFFLKGYDDI